MLGVGEFGDVREAFSKIISVLVNQEQFKLEISGFSALKQPEIWDFVRYLANLKIGPNIAARFYSYWAQP